jgi:hypothetical protein
MTLLVGSRSPRVCRSTLSVLAFAPIRRSYGKQSRLRTGHLKIGGEVLFWSLAVPLLRSFAIMYLSVSVCFLDTAFRLSLVNNKMY